MKTSKTEGNRVAMHPLGFSRSAVRHITTAKSNRRPYPSNFLSGAVRL